MNQKKINKILISLLVLLIVFIGYSRITEQKRVEYYICYDLKTSANYNVEPDIAKEYCHEQVYERND